MRRAAACRYETLPVTTSYRTAGLQKRPGFWGGFGLAVLASALLVPAGGLRAQQTGATAADPSGPAISIIYGLSGGDMLNVRASASPFGETIGRIANGAGVAKFACQEARGYDWCKIRALDDPTLAGWTPARYLREARPEEVTDHWKTAAANSREPENLAVSEDAPDPAPPSQAFVTTAEEAIALAIPDVTGPVETGPVGIEDEPLLGPPIPTPAPRGEAEAAGQPETVPFPSKGIEARLGGVDDKPGTATAPGAAGEPSVEEVYSLAFAADGAPLTGGIYGPAPLSAEEARASTQATPGFDAVGEIPCARYPGQPMANCKASIARSGDDAAEIVVAWPDGGTRRISFRAGKPETSDSPDEFRFTSEAGLNMIRIGPSERFEITDALAFGG
jgi:hypothetical protein